MGALSGRRDFVLQGRWGSGQTERMKAIEIWGEWPHENKHFTISGGGCGAVSGQDRAGR